MKNKERGVKMSQKSNASIEELLGATFECECGRTHSTKFSNFVMKEGAIKELPALLQKMGYQRPFLIMDTHTREAAGIQVEEVLRNAGFYYGKLVLKSPEIGDLPADEKALGAVVMAFDMTCDIIVSVGSGTINDLGRYFSYVRNMPFMLVATAPSMDGLNSGVAPLIQNNMKITFNAHAPLALLCDLSVMKQAPMKMLNAGIGDILGKYNCLTEWKLSHIINDEYYCDTIAGIMRNAIEKTVQASKSILEKKPEDVATLTEALALSGIAMDFAGNSRPASGAEHHVSHFFEMQFLFDGRPAVLHGTKVGIGTVLALRLYNELAKMEKPDFDQIRADVKNRMSFEEWEKEIRRAYRDGAEGIIALEKKAGKNDPEKLLKRLDVIEARWDEITALAATVPSADEIEALLVRLGAAHVPADVDIPVQYVADGIMYAKELRDRYTILQLLWDIDKLSDMKDLLLKAYC